MSHTMNPKSLANLTPWNSQTAPRNNGRPKGSQSISEHLKALEGVSVEELEKIVEDGSDNTRMMAARVRLVGCGKLDVSLRESEILSAFAEIADRTEGKPKQVTELTHNMGESRPVVLDQAKLEAAESLALERSGRERAKDGTMRIVSDRSSVDSGNDGSVA